MATIADMYAEKKDDFAYVDLLAFVKKYNSNIDFINYALAAHKNYKIGREVEFMKFLELVGILNDDKAEVGKVIKGIEVFSGYRMSLNTSGHKEVNYTERSE